MFPGKCRKSRMLNIMIFVLIVLPVMKLFMYYKLTETASQNDQETSSYARDLKRLKQAMERKQIKRLERIQTVCDETDIHGEVSQLFAYSPLNISYCSNHKVASTYWLKIFRFLHGDTRHHVRKPSDISKHDTHLTKFRKLKRRDFKSPGDYSETMKSYRLMVTRDPYQRLWSVYVDKFVLVDAWFWSELSPAIRKNFLTKTSRQGEMILMRKCLQISFCEFLLYVANIGTHKPQDLDDHMRPVHYGCNPCLFRPNYIASVENLTQEKKPILERLGLLGKDEVTSFEDHVINEIQTITEFGFFIWKRLGRLSDCVSDRQLEERLIKAFILNGYLPISSLETLKSLFPLGETKFKEKTTDFFRKLQRSSSQVKEQRLGLMVEAYRQIPTETLLAIQKIYQYDFLLFGYQSDPQSIFGSGTGHARNKSCVAEMLGSKW